MLSKPNTTPFVAEDPTLDLSKKRARNSTQSANNYDMESDSPPSTSKQTDEPKDPNTIDWDGPDDLANPLNWPQSVRLGHIVLVSALTLIVNLASTMFAPGAGLLMADFKSTNETIGALTVTIYLLGFALGPLLIAPLSEYFGRLIIYHVCNSAFLAFTIGCALSTNLGMFLGFRFLTGCAGSAPLTIGGGTVADVIPQEKRGAAMGIFAVGPLLGPVIGPIMGGFIAQDLGWKWTFWVLAILSGVVSIIALLFMRETYATVLLNRKASRLRKETGNLSLISKTDPGVTQIVLLRQAIIRPLKLLIFSPIVLSLSTFCALVFGLTFLLFTTFPLVFELQYGFSSGISGLAYLGLGIGMMFGVILFSVLSDKMVKSLTAKNGKVMKPEYRLPLMVYFVPVLPIGFFWYGWSAENRVHWMIPIIGTLFIGVGSLFVIMPAQVYLVDAFGSEAAASALAANTLLRSLFGTFLPLAGPKMYQSLGLGWGNSLLGFLALAFAPIPFFFYKYGERVRKMWVVNI